VVRITFIGLVGVSSWLWFLKYTQDNAQESLSVRVQSNAIWQATLKRGLTVGAAAVVVSLLTALFVPGYMVEFGVLHLIAASVVLIVPFLAMPRVAALLGVVFIVFGNRA